MKSSIGSDAFVLLALAFISLFVLLLLRHFLPLRTTPAYLVLPIFLSLALPISIILLVPIDLASSSRPDEEALRGIWLPEGVRLVAWRLTYWLTFALTWLILPLLGEYTDSGYRTPKDRIIYSLRSNARYQLIVIACAAAAGIYVFLQNGFAGGSVKSLVMALAYCWGLIMAIYLMGHGLVAVPRRLFRNADIAGRLKRIQSYAPKVNDRLSDANTELEELEAQLTQLRKRKNAVSRDHEEWIEDISDASSLPDSRIATTAARAPTPALPAVITDRYLAELTRKLIRARHKRARFIEAWDRLVQEAVDTQAIVDAGASRNLDFGEASPHSSWLERLNFLTPYTRYLLYARVVPAIRIAHGAIFSLASVCIVWSELVKYMAPKLSIISLTILSHSKAHANEVGFGGQVVASLWLLYMSMATLASFDDVKIWGNRALVRRNTYGESATWYSGQIAKLTVPLAYNFLTFFPRDVHRETTFYHFLGRLINLTPLGAGFDYFFPIFILIPVCATLFNLYGRVKNVFGFGILGDDDEGNPSAFGTGGWREGKELIDRELEGASRLGLSGHLDGPSSPLPSGTQSPIRTGSQQSKAPTGQSSRPGVPRQSTFQQRQAQRLADATAAAEEEDGNVFQGFAHRVKNTIDSVERPDWLNEIGKRPKWMGGVDGNSEGSGRADSGRGMGRWFGGRPADGRSPNPSPQPRSGQEDQSRKDISSHHRQLFEGGIHLAYGTRGGAALKTDSVLLRLLETLTATWTSIEALGLALGLGAEGSERIMAAVFGTLTDNRMGDSHGTQEREQSPWDFSTPVNQEIDHSASMSSSTNNQPPLQKLNFNPPSPPKSNGISPARNLPATPERHGQAYLTGKQSQPRSGAGMDPSYLSPPSKIGSRPELSASRSGSEADSLLDLYSKPRSLGESSLRESIDRVLPQEEPFLEDEDPERSRWIHRDKLAVIESHEMQEAGIKLPPQRKKSTISRSRSRREKNRSQDHSAVVPDRDGEMPPLKERKQRRTESPAQQDDRGDYSLTNDLDIRSPEEIAADTYMESNATNGSRQQQDLRKSSSRIPLPRSSPMPIPQEHIERDTPLPRKRGVSGNYSNGDENGLSYSRVRSRNNSVGSAILLDDIDNIPDHTPTPASDPAPLGQPTPSKPQRTPSSAQRPKSRSGLDNTPLSQKPRTISTTAASPRTPSSTSQRPKSRSGLDPRPATAINRPEGEPPWLATMYKPDPRLPPEEQLLPTHAKRLQQEQWERAQTESQQRIREMEAQQRKHNHDKPRAELPRDFSPLAEHTVNGLQPSSRDADEKALQEQSASEWPLTQATPRNPPASGGFNVNPAPTADGGQHAGYSPIPRVKQGASPTLGNITDIRPGQRVMDPFERERLARRDEEKGGKVGGGMKEKGCGCCVVM